MYLLPGDPTRSILGSTAQAGEYAAVRDQMGLNDPYIVQLGRYMYQVYGRLDLGSSYLTGVSITTELMGRIPRTLLLGFCSILVTLGIGIPLGVNAAVHQNTVRDWLPLSVALLGVSMPGFWFSLMLVLAFAVKLGWLPAYGMGGIQYWILPVLSGSFHGVANMARQTRSSMLEVIHSDYIVMARSKGLPERLVIYKHALPNALIPVITILGTTFAGLLGGAVLTETIFSIPGVGYYMVRSVNNRDYPAVEGSILLLSIVFCIVMLLTDLTMAAVDPRIKAQFASSRGKKTKETKEGDRHQ
jgi:peptide/nickel transport system permease protein